MVLREVLKGLLATLLAVLVLEGLLRLAYFVRNSTVGRVALPYTIGHDYGPVPPWIDGLRILEPDPRLLWKNRPDLKRRYVDVFGPAQSDEARRALLHRFLPPGGTAAKANVWEVALNSAGFRDAEFPPRKLPGRFRVVCLGDSWTFGANVGQNETYPRQLQARLDREFPGAFEVFNLGVLGYTSYQGLALLEDRATRMEPDFLLLGFAMNDHSVPGFRDNDMRGRAAQDGGAPMLAEMLGKLETYRLLSYLAAVVKYRPATVGDHLKAKASTPTEHGPVDYGKLEPWIRVSVEDYEKNYRGMITLAREHGAGVALLYNELWRDSPYRAVLERVSRTEGVPLIDTSALIAGARARMAETREARLGLRPAPAPRRESGGEVELVFRVDMADSPVPRAVYIAGMHPALGDAVPNRVRMHDDGTRGDQRPGDRVWSYAATLAPGTRVFYVYTNSGAEGRWEGLDLPEIRGLRVDAPPGGGLVYRPIEVFGKIDMQADSWHTDASGYALIANAVLEVLKSDEKVRRHLRRAAAGPAHGG